MFMFFVCCCGLVVAGRMVWRGAVLICCARRDYSSPYLKGLYKGNGFDCGNALLCYHAHA
jgi:hypothetical protein